jgi:hypothetical protein
MCVQLRGHTTANRAGNIDGVEYVRFETLLVGWGPLTYPNFREDPPLTQQKCSRERWQPLRELAYERMGVQHTPAALQGVPRITLLDAPGERRAVLNAATAADALRARFPSADVRLVVMRELSAEQQLHVLSQTSVFVSNIGSRSFRLLYLPDGAQVRAGLRRCQPAALPACGAASLRRCRPACHSGVATAQQRALQLRAEVWEPALRSGHVACACVQVLLIAPDMPIRLPNGTDVKRDAFSETECWSQLGYVTVLKVPVTDPAAVVPAEGRDWSDRLLQLYPDVYETLRVWDADVRVDTARLGDTVAVALRNLRHHRGLLEVEGRRAALLPLPLPPAAAAADGAADWAADSDAEGASQGTDEGEFAAEWDILAGSHAGDQSADGAVAGLDDETAETDAAQHAQHANAMESLPGGGSASPGDTDAHSGDHSEHSQTDEDAHIDEHTDEDAHAGDAIAGVHPSFGDLHLDSGDSQLASAQQDDAGGEDAHADQDPEVQSGYMRIEEGRQWSRWNSL